MEKNVLTEKIIKEHVLWSLGAGLLPIPIIDIAAVTLVQLDMLKQLCRVYERDYSASEGKVILSAMTGGTLARIGATMLKALPGIGTLLGGVSMSIMAGASTFAVARVAVRHFSDGGDLFNFDLDSAKKVYEEEFEKGKEYASDLEKERKRSAAVSDDVFKRLEKLAGLKEKGIISEEEFDAQKQKLLEQL
ncbi:MAG: DUF697 domain-containing protein [bacterium]|nr:DUF697 domain-containing protein [bacterium]